MSDFTEVRDALMLLDGREYDATEIHEAWLNGLAALDAIELRYRHLREVRDATVRWAERRGEWGATAAALWLEAGLAPDQEVGR